MIIFYLGGLSGQRVGNEIYAWKDEEWVEVGKMKVKRFAHGTSTIMMDDEAIKLCV